MKVVLDTNVLVSGLLSPFLAPAEIVRMTSAGILHICYDVRVISEYEQVLARPKFGFYLAHRTALLEQIKTAGFQAATRPLKEELPDREDEPFLEVAIAAKAACLITGNLKHYPPSLRQGVNVLSPQQFLDFYRKI